MFDTKYSDYNVVKATPFKRDIVKELAAACAKQGIKLHFIILILTGRVRTIPGDVQDRGRDVRTRKGIGKAIINS